MTNRTCSLFSSGSLRILQIMDEPPVLYDGKVTIRAFVEAAGKDSGKLLHARLQQDLIYWKAAGPTLTLNWLDQLDEPGASLFAKFDETELLIRELDQEHYSPAAQTAAELRDFGFRSRSYTIQNGASAISTMAEPLLKSYAPSRSSWPTSAMILSSTWRPKKLTSDAEG
jgi:hypothetical protein